MTAVKHNVADLLWDGPGEDVEVTKMTVVQQISRLYAMQVEIKTPSDAVAFQDALKAEAAVKLKCGESLDQERRFSGIITKLAQKRTRHGNLGGASGKMYLYDLEIRPKLWLLSKRLNSKVFQKKNAKDVVDEVLAPYGIQADWRLSNPPRKRDFRVQYQETDYNFISRILEDEGIAFTYDHDAGTVVFCDKTADFPACSPTDTARYNEETSPQFMYGKHEYISDFHYEEQIGTGKFTLNHYNYETSQTNIKADDTAPENCQFEDLEAYEHTHNYDDVGMGKDYAKLRREEETAQSKIARGFTSCRSFEAGHLFTLDKHFRGDFNKPWLLTHCRIEAEQGRYRCHFSAYPGDQPFRPQRVTPEPRIYGIQTATVTGPSGAKVYLDDLGRCKLQFHWDREGQKDDSASMWVRVANNYAGKDYGVQFIPRVGHEVLVSFIDGNPDLPVVTGRVYNDFNASPLKPANKYQNIIKSIKDNHIIFDDKDGQEMVDIRAQKDMTTLVINDETRNVKNNRTTQVDVDETVTVGSNRELNVGGDQKVTVGGNEDRMIGGSQSETIGSNQTQTVGGSQTITIASSQTESVGVSQNLNVGSSQSVSVAAAQNISVGGAHSLKIGGASTTTAGANIALTAGAMINLTATGGITISCGASTLSISPAGIVITSGASNVSVTPALTAITAPILKLN